MTLLSPTATVARSPRAAFAALLTAVLSFSLLQTTVVPALPQLQVVFDTSPANASWVLTSFLLSSSVATVLLRRLGDRYGKSRMLLVSIGLLGLGTLVAALAGSVSVLIAGRAVQGFGAATFPLAFGLVRELFPPERVAVAIGTISAMFGIGFGIGLVVPGPILDHLGWRWLFWLSLVTVVLALLAVALLVPHSPPTLGGRVDWAGALLVGAALVALLAISQSSRWSVPAVVGVLAVAVVALVAFALVESRSREPLLDLALLRRPAVAVPNAVSLLVSFGLYGAFTLVPKLLATPSRFGYGFDATATKAGLILLPMAVTMLFAGPLAGRLGSRVGFRTTLLLACVVAAVGYGVFALGIGSLWAIAVGAGVLGIGVGFSFSSVVNLAIEAIEAIEAVEPAETGQATGANTIVRTTGGAIGTQVSVAVVTAFIAAPHAAPDQVGAVPTSLGYMVVFGVSALALVIAAIATAVTPRPVRR
ncbi:hypothetical protein GCM10009836_25590 [Pseudonocardia ailaonensis]|uniref:Major facilitator superfamily (MFS) profile domain-containing protein n=1 Tax=Pseudonocardia ailaonensis TaxID=367279 RepID=A0ABN2N0A5_9PSEU